MEARLTFNIPDDRIKHLDAINGTAWRELNVEIEAHIRSWEQVHSFQTPDELIGKLSAIMQKAKLNAGLTYKA